MNEELFDEQQQLMVIDLDNDGGHESEEEEEKHVFDPTPTREEALHDEQKSQEEQTGKTSRMIQSPWIECETTPEKLKGNPTKRKTFVYDGNEYKHHKTNKLHSLYRCSYQKSGCKAELKRVHADDKWYNREVVHSHSSVGAPLSNTLQSNLNTFEELCSRGEFRNNCRGQQYIRVYRNLPIFLFQVAAEWQLDLLRNLSNKDQFFLCVTNRVHVSGVQKMITLLLKKSNWSEALPLVHTLVKAGNEKIYKEMWSCIVWLATEERYSAPNICQLKEKTVSVIIKFEKDMCNAIREVLPNARIIGRNFSLSHLIATILKQKHNKFGKVVKEDMSIESNINDLVERIEALAAYTDEESFAPERTKFVLHYQEKPGYEHFVRYFIKEWLGSEEEDPKYPYTLWAKFQLPRMANEDTTNNLIDTFHSNMDQKFSKTLDIKRCMETLLEIEEEYFTIRQRLKTSHKKTSANAQAINGGKRSRRPEHPASKKQKLDNTTQPSQLDNPPQSSVN